jgi:hypothetical protein
MGSWLLRSGVFPDPVDRVLRIRIVDLGEGEENVYRHALLAGNPARDAPGTAVSSSSSTWILEAMKVWIDP